MANILSLALKINADASGLKLDPVQRALVNLGNEADKLNGAFAKFAGSSEAAAKAQERTAAQSQALINGLRDGTISSTQFAAQFEKLTQSVNAEAAAFDRAAKIIESSLTAQQKYDRQIQELTDHLKAGRLTQEQYNAAAAKAQQGLTGVGSAADRTDKTIQSLASNTQILARIELGRLLLDGFRVVGSAISQVQSQVTSLVTSVNASINQIDDFAQRTGIGVEALQGYSLAAKLAGVDTEQFGAAVQKLSVSIGQATPGDALDKSLRAINLSVQELRALSPEQQFSVIGEAISQLPTVADRAAAAVEIFGKQGAALAPLFKEGAASIEELQQRAERLGIIVSEQQVNNVTAMNDAFDLVSATVQGIIGQVIGNLAPAVTAVTEEFLRFVEEWSGAQGQGGTGIANAITDTLLSGAEVLAGVFDAFVEQFGGFSTSLESVSSAFTIAGNIFKAVADALTVAFNMFEVAGNAIAFAIGKLLEAVGSYVSSDLERFGKDLQEQANLAARQNVKQIEDAAKGAAQAVSDAFTGGEATPEAAGQGAATQFIQGIRARLDAEQEPAFKINSNVDELRERFDAFYGGIIDSSSDITNAMREFEAVVAAAQEDAALTADEIDKIEAAQKRVNDLMDAELRTRREATEAAAAQADQDQKRIEGLLKTTDAAAKVEEDILAVQREQARVSEQIAAARNQRQQEAAAEGSARLAQLDQLQASLQDQQQALEQGFGQGFKAAFDQTGQAINGLADKAAEFGNAGARAYTQLQQSVAVLQQQARDGILGKAAYEAEVERQKAIFDERLRLSREVENAIRAQLTDRERFEADLVEQQKQRKIQAAKLVAQIEEQIAATREALKVARDDGNLVEAKAAVQRLRALDDVLGKEKQIAAGKLQSQEQLQEKIISDQKAAAEQQTKIQEQLAQEQERRQQQRENILNDIAARRQQQFERDVQRIQELNTLGPRAVQGIDLRTQQGADLVLGLELNRQDPALIEQRIQTKVLLQVRDAIIENIVRNVNAPTAIVGMARLN